MVDDKMKILNMLAEGKISAQEAEKLLSAVDKAREPEGSGGTDLISSLESKFLYVQVEPKGDESSERVSVKIPFALLKAGLNIMGLIPEDVQETIQNTMNEKGMSFNLKDIKPENAQSFLTALEQLSIDVDADDSTVKVYCR
ncbi:MAG: hypothetical protein PQJ50_10475 [Spirochaetales bacterium]|nr:hypothetical protein [Spirochaetales bacterium]